VLEVAPDGRISGFEEKPREPLEMPGKPGWALASMGNYIFKGNVLIEALEHDALQDTSHDFGKTIIPALLADGARLYAYDFSTNRVPGGEELAPYWRDVGTVDSYWDASMDLVAVTPPLNLYNPRWPIKSLSLQLPPAKFVFADAASQRIGLATDSTVAAGCIISGGTIHRSILFSRVRVNSFSHIEECVLMDGVDIGRHARLRRVIADKGVKIPPQIEIGFDEEEDRQRYHVSEGGVVVLPKGAEIPEPAKMVAVTVAG
jgi:glucose-1-phosphate adenylyltransferase